MPVTPVTCPVSVLLSTLLLPDPLIGACVASSAHPGYPGSTTVAGIALAVKKNPARILGPCWPLLGAIYLTILTRGFRRPPPEASVAE